MARPAYERRAGTLTSATILPFPLQHKRKSRCSPAQKAGLRYEKCVFEMLLLEIDDLKIHPTLKFRNEEYPFDQYAIPDALSLHNNILTIIEIKLRHTSEGYRQLHNFYRPIVSRVYPSAHINLLEICQHYDPSVQLPRSPEVVDGLVNWISKPQLSFGVFLWSGR